MIFGDPKSPTFSVSKHDNFNTPKEAFELLFHNMLDSATSNIIWFPFWNDGSLIECIKSLRLNIIHENKNFFEYEPDNYDIIVDNPPFSCKREIIERCLTLNKPFALLVPLETIERTYLTEKLKQNMQILIPRRRYNFTDNTKKRAPFKSVWLTFKMPMTSTEKLIFES